MLMREFDGAEADIATDVGSIVQAMASCGLATVV